MLEEASLHRPGGACLLGRLAELLFVEVLRRSMEGLRENEIGWLAAVKDPAVGKTLQLMHGELAHPWTVESLGRCVGLSRSALADRFRHLLGESVMQYLSRWRLQLAAQLLRDTDNGIADIAGRVGYESEAAFNRAFKRHAGEPPATWRTGARARALLSR
jgi:AraC family transcriptional regulator, alkane utilization regulator